MKFFTQHPKHAVLEKGLTSLFQSQRLILLADDTTSYGYVLKFLSTRIGEDPFDLRQQAKNFADHSLYYLPPCEYPMANAYQPVRRHVFDRQQPQPGRRGEKVRIVELHTNQHAAKSAMDYWDCESIFDISYDAEAYREYFRQADAKLCKAYDTLPRWYDVQYEHRSTNSHRSYTVWDEPIGRTPLKPEPLIWTENDRVLLDMDELRQDEMRQTSPTAPMWHTDASKLAEDYTAKIQERIELRQKLLPQLRRLKRQFDRRDKSNSERTLDLLAAGLQVTRDFKRISFSIYNENLITNLQETLLHMRGDSRSLQARRKA